jgi:hypothetical protein
MTFQTSTPSSHNHLKETAMTELPRLIFSTAVKLYIVAVIIFCMNFALAGIAAAEALWYKIESGSKVEIFGGAIIYLSGNIEIGYCGEADKATNPDRDLYPLHFFRFDNAPEELSYVKGVSSINLFGGPGVSMAVGHGSIHVYSDGRVNSFSFPLRYELAEERQDFATIYFRKLETDKQYVSRLHFTSDQDACPQGIEINLLIEDVWTIYKPERTTNLNGEQIVVSRGTPGQQKQSVGRVTIFATAIPDSLHYVREPRRIQKIKPGIKNDSGGISIRPMHR